MNARRFYPSLWQTLRRLGSKTRKPSGETPREEPRGIESLESRIAPATLDITGTVLTFTLDAGASDAGFSGTGGNLTFDSGTGNTITLTGLAAGNGFNDGDQTSTGSAFSAFGLTEINIVGSTGTETFTIGTLDDDIAGLDIDATVENVVISATDITTQDISTNGVHIGGAVTLAENLTISTAGSSFEGDVTFDGAINSALHKTLSIDAGTTGIITFGAAIGATNRLGGLAASGGSLSLGGDIGISTGTLNLVSAAAGISLGNHAYSVTSGGNVSLTGVGITQGSTGSVTTSGGGTISLDGQAAGIDLAGSLQSDNNTATAIAIADATSLKLGNITATGGSSAGVAISTITGTVDQNVGTTVSAQHFSVSATGDIDLSANNNFTGTVSLSTASTSDITVHDTNDLTLGNVTLSSGTLTATATNITYAGTLTGGYASLEATASIVLTGTLNTGTLNLEAGTTINQTSGEILATHVSTVSNGAVTLTEVDNSIGAFEAVNTGSNSAITLANGYNGFVIGPITNNGGAISIDNSNGATLNDADVTGDIVRGGSTTGDISLTTSGTLSINALVSTAGGSGGVLAISDAVDLSHSLTLGGGDITLQGGEGELRIGVNLTFSSSYTLSSKGDIVIDASVTTTGSSSDLTLIADSDLSGGGGVQISSNGYVAAGRDLSITGSSLAAHNDQGVRIEADGSNIQVQATRNLLLSTSSVASANFIGLGGYVTITNAGPTVGNIRFAGNTEVIDAANVYGAGTGSITFEDALESGNHYALTLKSDLGNINFDSTVGFVDSLGSLTITNAFNVTAASSIEATQLTITNASGSVAITGFTATTDATTGVSIHTPSLSAGGFDAQNAGDIVLEIDSIAITGTVSGTGDLTIRPITASRTIGLNGAGDLQLSTAELAQLQDGFNLITIGSLTGTGNITSAGATFHDAVTLLSPGGTFSLTDTLESDGAGSDITVKTKNLALNFDAGSPSSPTPVIATQGAAISITSNISLLQNTFISSSTGAIGGDITITGTINGAKTLAIDAYNAGTGGTVTFNGVPKPPGDASIGGGTRLTSLTVDADTINLTPHTHTTGDQTYRASSGIVTHGGAYISYGGGDITFDGPLTATLNLRVSTTGDITFTDTVDNGVLGGAGSLSVNSGGSLTFIGAVGGIQPLSFATLTATNLTVGGTYRVANALTITASQVDLGGADTVLANTFVLQSSSDTQGISIGLTTEGAGPALQFGHDDVLALANGISQITIGRAAGVGLLSIDEAVNFHDNVRFLASPKGAGLISVDGDVSADAGATIVFNAAKTNLGANVSASGTGTITFNAVNLTADAQVSSGSGAITFTSPVTSTNASDLTVDSTSGLVIFKSTVGNGKATSRPGALSVTTGGTINIGTADASSISLDGLSTILHGKLLGAGAGGISVANAVTLTANTTLQTIAGPITLGGDIDSPSRAYSLTLTSKTGDISSAGDIGSTDALAGFLVSTGTTGSSDVTLLGSVTAKSVNIKGDHISSSGTIDTTSTQTYTGGASVSLGRLNGLSTLAVTGTHLISNTAAWTFSGIATLKTTSTSSSDSISVTGTGNAFSSVRLTGHNATIVTDATLNVGAGKISAVSGVGGVTTLTSLHGDVLQVSTFETSKLVGTATEGSIRFESGTLKVASLGAMTAQDDITVVRSAPGTLKLTGVLEAGSNIVIVADYGSSKATFDNLVGATLFDAPHFVIYGYSKTATLGNLRSIQATALGTFLRYSPNPLNPGNPALIAGATIVYATK